jgi:hypothetical protein
VPRTTNFTERDCEPAGARWLKDIQGTNPARAGSTSVLLFREDGQLCFAPNARPAQGDPIYAGVFTDDSLYWANGRITFQPCSLEPSSPSVLVSDRLPQLAGGQLQAANFDIEKFPVRQCWDRNVVINIEPSASAVPAAGSARQISYTLTQASRYRATLHLGVVFTENHETTFGLRPDGNVNRVFAEGPVDKGPEYVAALVFYSILRYIPPLGGKASYQGRDPVEDNGFADKLGAVIGVGLQNPLKRFVTGFSFEIAAGVNVLGVWDWNQANVLSGINEGDIFTGTEEEIPVFKEWQQKFVFGVSMDLVYATNAFRR